MIDTFKKSKATPRVFGVDLIELTKLEHSPVPLFVERVIDYLEHHGIKQERILAQNGSLSVINKAQEQIDRGYQVDFTAIGPYAAGDLLKRFLCELPNPLIPHDAFLRLANLMKSDKSTQLQQLEEMIQSLPQQYAQLLEFVIFFCVKVISHQATNKMTVENTARVMAPILMPYVSPSVPPPTVHSSPSTSTSTLNAAESLHDSPKRNGVIVKLTDATPSEFDSLTLSFFITRLLIENHHSLFAKVTYYKKRLTFAINKCTHSQHRRFGSKERGLRILALDGGGMRGVSELTILSVIAHRLFGDDGPEATRALVNSFDLVCGTSTGAIVALAMLNTSLKHCRDMYYTMADKIFVASYYYGAGRWWRYYRNGDYYDGNALYEFFKSHLGNQSMCSFKTNPNDTKLFITATDATTDFFEPFLFRTYENPTSHYQGTSNIEAALALRASCAAPTYFAPVKFGGRIYVDGGFLYNNPTEVALFEAHHLWPNKQIECIISLGTGIPKAQNSSENVFSLVGEIINLCTSSEIVHQRILNWLEYLEVRPQYLRFNAPPPLGSVPLDTGDKRVLDQMVVDTEKYMNDVQQQEAVATLCQLLSCSLHEHPSNNPSSV
jgi:predicted acylesterase/phospholipase RssA